MIETYGLSDVGCMRELNEDCFCIHGFSEGEEKGYCILADGMGGHNAGEVASQNAVKTVSDELLDMPDSNTEAIPKRLIRAIDSANEKVYRMSVENPAHSGMGTTVVAAYIDNGTVYLANVGDSRAYIYGVDGFKQITVDHSVVEELVRCGSITREESRFHPQKNIITRAVGTEPTVTTDLFEYEYSKGDILILCSDGLTTMLTDKEISDIIDANEATEKTVRKLIEAAKANGGLDNVTVVCGRFI